MGGVGHGSVPVGRQMPFSALWQSWARRAAMVARMSGWAITTLAPATALSRRALVPSHLFALFTTTPVDQRRA